MQVVSPARVSSEGGLLQSLMRLSLPAEGARCAQARLFRDYSEDGVQQRTWPSILLALGPTLARQRLDSCLCGAGPEVRLHGRLRGMGMWVTAVGAPASEHWQVAGRAQRTCGMRFSPHGWTAQQVDLAGHGKRKAVREEREAQLSAQGVEQRTAWQSAAQVTYSLALPR